MTKAQLWGQRVAAWRASGLCATDFCKGQDFTAGQLRNWVHRLEVKKGGPGGSAPATVPLARVEVASPIASAPVAKTEPQVAGSQVQTPPEPALVLEAQGVRIAVRPGFDRATLASVLDVLDQRTPSLRTAS